MTMTTIARAALLLACAPLAGCATSGALYNYGDYSDSLYAYQRDPTERADYIEELQEIISKGSEPGTKPVPPGIRAELGYMMLEAGDMQQAELLFQQEKQAWPESQVFMDRLIAVARGEAPRDFAAAPPPPTVILPASAGPLTIDGAPAGDAHPDAEPSPSANDALPANDAPPIHEAVDEAALPPSDLPPPANDAAILAN